MNIEIEKAAIHSLSGTYDNAHTAPLCLELSESALLYAQRLAQKAFESDEARAAQLSHDSPFNEILSNISDLFFEKTCDIANGWNSFLSDNTSIPDAEVLFLLASIDGAEVFAALKLPRKSGVVHVVNGAHSSLEQIDGVLPTAGGRADEAFFFRMSDKGLRIIEKKYDLNGHKGAYLSQLLGCATGHSKKEALSAICEAAVEVNRRFYGQLGADEPVVAAAVVEEFRANPEALSAKTVCEKLYKDLPHAKEAFENVMAEQEIPFDMPVEISAPAVRRLEKQSLRSGSGVEIKLPVSVYHNPEAVEFLKNDDGTTSLLVKNILI